MAKKRLDWHLDWLQVSAVALVFVLALFFLGLFSNDQSGAMNIAEVKPIPVIQAELGETQPQRLIQREEQWLARFKLSTESIDPVTVTGLVFYPQGSLQNQIIFYLRRYPLSVMSRGKLLGKDETWLRDNGYITQEVSLDIPLKIDALHPIELDVYTDLLGQYQETFGLWLSKVVSEASTKGLPLQGKLYEVQERF